MNNCPCLNCITFPICNSRVKAEKTIYKRYRELIVISIEKCQILKAFLEPDPEVIQNDPFYVGKMCSDISKMSGLTSEEMNLFIRLIGNVDFILLKNIVGEVYDKSTV